MNTLLIKEDIKKLPKLFLGYLILSFGIYLTKLAYVGMSAWSVFHDGLSIYFSLSFGLLTVIVGIIILALSIIFLKAKVGVGTILNIIVIGPLIDFMDVIYHNTPDNKVLLGIIFVFGLLFTTFGRSLYIASRLGPGPRDGLFVGLARVTQIDVKYIKPLIEFIVLGIGYALGGNLGIGTVILIVTSGYLVQFFFGILGFDAKGKSQSNILDYFIANEKESQFE